MFTISHHNDQAKLMGILMVLKGEALVWFESLEKVVKGDWYQLKQALQLCFARKISSEALACIRAVDGRVVWHPSNPVAVLPLSF